MKKIKLLLCLSISIASYSQQLTLDTSYANQGINNLGLASTTIYNNQIDGISNASYLMTDKSMLIPFSLNPNYSMDHPNLAPTIGIKKFLENGSLDPSFGTNGIALFTSNFHADRFEVNGITMQPDGKIILVGRTYLYADSSPDYEMFICRFNSDGTKDTTFGYSGLVKLNTYVVLGADSNDERLVDVTVDSQDRILAVGYNYKYLGNSTFNSSAVAIRFLPNGTVDTTFASNGYLDINSAGIYNSFSNIYPIGTNQFLLYGTAGADLLVTKINDNGSLDTTFGVNGYSQVGFGSSTYPVKLFSQPNNEMMIVGLKVGTGLAFAKLNSDGSLDTSFSSDGKNTTYIPVPNHYNVGSESYPDISSDHIDILPDNKFILISSTRINNSYDYVIARINEDTTLDTTFMTNGIYLNDVNAFDWARGIHVQSDGKIVAIVGSTMYRYLNFSVLGLDNIVDSNSKINIYPNPTNDFVHFGIKAQNAVVQDPAGKILDYFKDVNEIDFSNYTTGMYFIDIQIENGKKNIYKVIKK